MKTTIIYIRVSTSQQAENGLSLENQLNRLREYCKYHGFQNIIEISDEGISGKSTNRPGFQKMIELAKKHQIDNVIVYSLSRFARNTIDTIKTMNLFNKCDVSFHSITESLDTSTAIGRFFISTLASLSQLEREQIGERTKSVLQMKKEKGERIGQISFGYKLVEDGKVIICEDEQETLSIMKSLKRKGYTFQRVAEELSRLKRNSKKNGSSWTVNQVRRLFNRHCLS